MWVVGLIGLVAGLALLIYVPTLPAISATVVLFAGFHLAGAVVSIASLYVLTNGTILLRSQKIGSTTRLRLGSGLDLWSVDCRLDMRSRRSRRTDCRAILVAPRDVTPAPERDVLCRRFSHQRERPV
jgi:hypothetical protein